MTLDDEIQRRIQAVKDALDIYRPGLDSASDVEVPKLKLANAVLDAIAKQTAAHDEQIAGVPRAHAVRAKAPTRERKRRA